ncbi:electron transporter [Striga asiatica]|uniref:Electron transporter n=1 Tax=Striga asiatica TaxID=4170 RepID=A0A5A7PYZ3_STRAF|nr:electron transporter [Striga asiatica]
MDLCCVHAKGNDFLLRSSFSEKSVHWGSRAHSMAMEIRASRWEALPSYFRHRSVLIKAMARKNSGNFSNSNSNSSSGSGGGDGLKSNDKSGDKSQRKPLDWREFRASLYIQEQTENADYARREVGPARPKPFPDKWAHPISAPEKGCLLVATEKLDGDRTFERTVILLLHSKTENHQEIPYGIIVNRPLDKKMKNRATFADCSLHFGGPLEASMFLLRAHERIGPHGFEEVIPGLYLGSRNSLDEASALVKKGIIEVRDFSFFLGYAGWQMDQLIEEIESGYWYLAACSANLISSWSDDLWGEILQLMGGRYSELSRKPKQDM